MRWWQRESTRQLLGIPAALLGSLLGPGERALQLLTSWDLYAIVYLGLTWLALRTTPPERLAELARSPRRRTWATWFFVSTPDQLSQAAAAVALVATVFAMPQVGELGTSTAVALGVCLVAVVTAWLTLHTGFLMSYVGEHAERGGLDFPGTPRPGLTEFVYFTASVATTFGTTDVSVTSTRLRRRVSLHNVLAFVFNTLVLTIAITFTTGHLDAT
jgi:uncharacterized membrane protein